MRMIPVLERHPVTNMTAAEDHRPVWFVGAFRGGADVSDRFIREGIWRGGPEETYGDQIASMAPGDRIAIKASYSRKRGLPFDNRGKFVSVMAIKAIGEIVENPGDRESLRVNWTPVDPAREWYFANYFRTIWQVVPDRDWARELIRFAFENKKQNLEMFLHHPYWGERYGWPLGNPTIDTPPQYEVDDIVFEGCFTEPSALKSMLQRLAAKHNLILQGPPGTGKTWLARRLAYALIGRKDPKNVRQIQFHPSLSYEDVVRGWRPQGDGSLKLVDGPFLELCEIARRDPSSRYVVVIEEINRGNPAAIFGELLTLMEADKKTPENALTLAHRREVGERFYVPPNLFVIGTMNLADRSLALVDLALRRRFAVFTLEPELGETWLDWVHSEFGISTEFLDQVADRINGLNQQIDDDPNLGPNFRVGHSFVTPNPGEEIDDPEVWYRQVVENEIAPLLGEYWFDDPVKAGETGSLLLVNN